MTNRDGIPRLKLSEALFVVPCSGGKAPRGTINRTDGISVLDFLPSPLADELRCQRNKNACKAKINESSLIPAYKRYTGYLYQAAGDAFNVLLGAGVEILIISGGYGIVHAREPIGWYNREFGNADWPNCLVQRCLADYAAHTRVKTMVGLFSRSGYYGKTFRKTHWPKTVERVWLATPLSCSGSNARKTVPSATGEALAAIARDQHLEADWTSRDGLHMEINNLLAR